MPGILQFLAACLICEIEGMKVMNKEREQDGLAYAYDENAFIRVRQSYETRANHFLFEHERETKR